MSGFKVGDKIAFNCFNNKLGDGLSEEDHKNLINTMDAFVRLREGLQTNEK